MQRIEIKAVFGLIIIAILTRLLPHPPNAKRMYQCQLVHYFGMTGHIKLQNISDL